MQQSPRPPRGVSREPFGRTPQGELVEQVTLVSGSDVSVRILTWGATIQSVMLSDRSGTPADVTLGFATLDGYLAQTAYMGVTVGRVANRIAGGRFRLDGVEYRVPANDGPNALHGGSAGLDRRNWEVVALGEGAEASVTLRCVSPDGDQGFPGELTVTATFHLSPDGVLAIDYVATTDRPTPVNITSHAYWNMAGEGAPEGAMGNVLTLHADAYLPTDRTAIPTGEVRPVEGTPFDFRQPIPVGLRVRDAADGQILIGRGYDHNWVLSREPAPEPRPVARLEDPASGRAMELWSDQPGLQMYSGNFLDGSLVGKAGRAYRQGDAVVLEPQMFPDTPNRPEFGSVRLDPGRTYRNRIRFRFFTS
jgi:aldose 1-epimerase